MTDYIKRGDTNPPFKKSLRNESGESIDVSDPDENDPDVGIDVRFNLRDENFNVIVSDNTSGNVSIVDPISGKVQYEWQPDDTIDVGSYKGEFVVDDDTKGVRSFPVNGHYDIEIVGDIK